MLLKHIGSKMEKRQHISLARYREWIMPVLMYTVDLQEIAKILAQSRKESDNLSE